jgi:hypothetical protein
MNEFTEVGQQGQSVKLEAWGDTRELLELAALDAARGFFGADTRLRVDPNFHARYWPDHEPKFHAEMTVWVVFGD